MFACQSVRGRSNSHKRAREEGDECRSWRNGYGSIRPPYKHDRKLTIKWEGNKNKNGWGELMKYWRIIMIEMRSDDNY